jgi:hypothetical protein
MQTDIELRPDSWYSPREIAKAIKSGARPVYTAINTGELRAAAINARGDLRSQGAWVLEFLERRAESRPKRV